MSGVNKGLTMWNNNTNQPRKRRNVNNTFSKFNVELAEAGFRSTALQYHAVLPFWLFIRSGYGRAIVRWYGLESTLETATVAAGKRRPPNRCVRRGRVV